jgi:hypothetical protein
MSRIDILPHNLFLAEGADVTLIQGQHELSRRFRRSGRLGEHLVQDLGALLWQGHEAAVVAEELVDGGTGGEQRTGGVVPESGRGQVQGRVAR